MTMVLEEYDKFCLSSLTSKSQTLGHLKSFFLHYIQLQNLIRNMQFPEPLFPIILPLKWGLLVDNLSKLYYTDIVRYYIF